MSWAGPDAPILGRPVRLTEPDAGATGGPAGRAEPRPTAGPRGPDRAQQSAPRGQLPGGLQQQPPVRYRPATSRGASVPLGLPVRPTRLALVPVAPLLLARLRPDRTVADRPVRLRARVRGHHAWTRCQSRTSSSLTHSTARSSSLRVIASLHLVVHARHGTPECIDQQRSALGQAVQAFGHHRVPVVRAVRSQVTAVVLLDPTASAHRPDDQAGPLDLAQRAALPAVRPYSAAHQT